MSEGEPIRVVIVDDHAVVRSGLSAFLMSFDDLELAGEAGSGEDGLRIARQLEPDVILMDMVMPEMDGAEATLAIREELPEVQVIALTSFKDEDLVRRAMEAGAIGYLLKDTTADELADAIRAAIHGEPTLAREAAEVLIRAATRKPQVGHDLTPREREVLALMTEGFSNPDIAERLVVSRSTVKFHVSSILSKLGVSSRTEAVALTLQNKILG
jgi:NarL family two-component system response regulator LiaR